MARNDPQAIEPPKYVGSLVRPPFVHPAMLRVLFRPAGSWLLPFWFALGSLGSGALALGAQPRDLFGSWRVTTGVVAPWAIADSATLDRSAFLTRAVAMEPRSFSGFGGMFACASPRYERTTMPPDGLFQGNLPAPAASAARTLGFAKGAVRGMRLTCATGTFEFHEVDSTHLLVAIDNIIWTLDRSPGAFARPTSPEGALQSLLERHFGGSMGLDSTAIQRLSPFLSASLARRIADYLAVPASPDEAPVIDGDPFTDSQEYPTRFSVQRGTVSGDRATVPVRFADGYASRTLRYQLRSGAQGWRVNDIRYEHGGTFVDALRVPAPTTSTPARAEAAWAEAAWRKESASRGLARDSSVMPVMWIADFDGDGKADIAWLVKHSTSRARGILIVHASGRAAQLCGAGVMFGNGGDNFDWMDTWRVVPSRSGKGSALVVEKSESAGGRIEFRGGRYRWVQVGD